MTKDTYFDLCEQLNSEPLDDEIPIEIEDLPYEVQQAWKIFDLLPDRFDSFSGNYYGKDLSSLLNYFSLFDIIEKISIVTIIQIFDFYESKEINIKIKNRPKD